MSRPSSIIITCQILPHTLELWPLNCPKTELAVSALQVENPAAKNVVITIEPPKQDGRILCKFGTLVFFYISLLILFFVCSR